jgi:hypothetical protein
LVQGFSQFLDDVCGVFGKSLVLSHDQLVVSVVERRGLYMICNSLFEIVFKLNSLFHDKVAIQNVNTHEPMKQGGGGLVLNYHSNLSHDYSIEFIENRN